MYHYFYVKVAVKYPFLIKTYPFKPFKNPKPASMFARIKETFFTDSLTIEWEKMTEAPFKFVLKNDEGKICSTIETYQHYNKKYFNWRGLNDLPYGRYFLELSNMNGNQLVKLVKRV